MKNKIWIVFLSIHSTVFAGIGQDMSKFFNKFGAVSNYSEASAFKDQSGGYYNGGSFFMRSPSRNLQPVSMTPPGYRMGCGGIDIWTGGISFINAQQLKDTLAGIVSNGIPYAFMLAVETYAPQVHGIMQQLNKLASDFNNMNINSCEAAAGLVGSAWPKSNLGSQATCRMLSAHDGRTADWARARHECGNNVKTGIDRATQDQLVGEFNLAWVVLQKINFDMTQNNTNLNVFADEKEDTDKNLLKELFMTFSGTIIRVEENVKDKHNHDTTVMKKRIFPALGDRETFLKALMSGGEVSIYKCDEQKKCLNPTKGTIHVEPNSALHTKIVKILDDLSAKIQDDEGQHSQTEAEESLMNATSLPLYKFINVTTAYQKGRSPISLSEFAEIIALDVILTYVNDILMCIREAVSQIKDEQFYDDDLEEFLKNIRESQQSLMGVRQNTFQKIDQVLSFVQKTQMIETQLHHMMGNLSEMR